MLARFERDELYDRRAAREEARRATEERERRQAACERSVPEGRVSW